MVIVEGVLLGYSIVRMHLNRCFCVTTAESVTLKCNKLFVLIVKVGGGGTVIPFPNPPTPSKPDCVRERVKKYLLQIFLNKWLVWPLLHYLGPLVVY